PPFGFNIGNCQEIFTRAHFNMTPANLLAGFWFASRKLCGCVPALVAGAGRATGQPKPDRMPGRYFINFEFY
ncbi:MAG: hypothetical protein Q8L80_11105, partial [Gallionella sp.]|nr:hypothetical protein [Gallionella sp.]